MEELAARTEPEATGASKQARVTVVIPTYNRARWLGGAMKSVRAVAWLKRVLGRPQASARAAA